MRILVKVGGAQLERADARQQLARSIAAAQAQGHEVLLVHGGGNQIRDLGRRLQIADRYQDGLRVTDAETAEVALMVLSGQVNRSLVASLAADGVRAIGLSGADGLTFTAKKHDPDLGYVGTVHRVRPDLVHLLSQRGYVPVLCTVAPLDAELPGATDHFYNINADHAAGPLARELDCVALLFLTNVPGVLDQDQQLLAQLTEQQCAALRERGVIRDGMIPKTQTALRAAAELPDGLVKIAPAAGDNAILQALDATTGTRFTTGGQPSGEPHG